MPMENAREMLVHELGDMMDAETRLRNALEKMAKKCTNQNLKTLFEDHREETEGQIERLQQVFKDLEEKAKRQPCKGMRGLIDEFETFVKEEKPEDDLLDVFACGAAIKVEHYEISAYESLIKMAKQLGLEEEAKQLEETLQEEQTMLQRLQEIGQELISQLPAEEEMEMEEEEEEAAASTGGKRSRSR
ncbi:MAG TPA: ferritin-like domain-containing protein [Planctomycetota bacterium]|nr:ferritin-like domain-containing protein [Planctomycetota bacterium]